MLDWQCWSELYYAEGDACYLECLKHDEIECGTSPVLQSEPISHSVGPISTLCKPAINSAGITLHWAFAVRREGGVRDSQTN